MRTKVDKDGSELMETVVYETSRLYVCVLDESHLSALQEIWGDEEVMALCNGATPHHLLLGPLNGYRKCHEVNGLSVYALKNKQTGEIIGTAGFNITGPLEEIELIYHFNKKFWGQGFATEAATACLELAKRHGAVKKVIASADMENIGSLKILEKIGFTYKGVKWFDDTQQEEPFYEYELK